MVSTGSRRARPHTATTAEGHRVREVLTYSRRGSRLSAAQAEVWRRRAGDWWIPDESVDEVAESVDGAGGRGRGAEPFAWDHWFGRAAPLVVEVGSGIGEATVALAARRPEVNVVAFEVWSPGLAETFRRLERTGVENVRLMSIDAVWSLEHLLAPGGLAELWTFFPDPWPKQRHERRRLVRDRFATLVSSRLAPGGLWRLATDVEAYAEQMRHVLDAEPDLVGGPTPRWADRPLTRFERRGLRAGRSVSDLTYRRR